MRRFVADATFGRDPIRVILTDEHEVMYEAWWTHLRDGRGDWGMRRLRRCIYYRAATAWLVENSQHIGHQPLDTTELE